MIAPLDHPQRTSGDASPTAVREAVLEYRDGSTSRVPVREPAPAAIVECATLTGLTELGYERVQRRFAYGGCFRADRSDTLRYVESDVLTAAFRCGACGSAPGLAYLPRDDEFIRLHDALPTSNAGVGWQLCWPCYAAWARAVPVRRAPTPLRGRVAKPIGWLRHVILGVAVGVHARRRACSVSTR